jgi:hypothetical protein
MKKIYFGLILTVLFVLLLVPPVQAQQTMDPNSFKMYYQHSLVTTRSYANSTTDTIPNLVINHWTQATHKTDRLGGASYLTLKINPADSMYAVVYIDELIDGTYTNILQDSILTATGVAKEFVVRSQNAEKTGSLTGSFRARINFPAWHTQGVADATDNPTYDADWDWKP